MSVGKRRRRDRCWMDRPRVMAAAAIVGVGLEMYITLTSPLPAPVLDLFDQAMLRSAHRPRVVVLGGDARHRYSRRRARQVDRLGTGVCRYCNMEPDHHWRDHERPYHDECTPMAEWQSNHYPTCNTVHEGALTQLELLSTAGSWRSVWKLHEDTFNKTAVVKLLRLSREFDHESFEYHRVDAVVMERLTSSPYVVDVFQHCGQTVYTEFASSSARTHIKDESFGSLDRLRMGRNLARAFAAIHSIDYPKASNATLAHNDINIANAVEIDGQIKLNDFNLAILMRWNKTQPCGAPVRFEAPLWKSPEEVRHASYFNPAQADVYGLGNLLFQVMTKHQPWTHLEPEGKLDQSEVARRKLAGRKPSVPAKYSSANKTAFQALYYATMAAFEPDPVRRLTSDQLAHGLDLVYQVCKRHLRAPREDIEELFTKEFWHVKHQVDQERAKEAKV